MNTIDEALKANETYAKSYNSALGRPPTPRLAIVTCMDPRLTNILQALGLGAGDADVIRNAGSAITEDSLRSLLVSTRVLGSQEIMIINHTDCGMTTFKDEELDAKLQKLTGTAAVEPARFYSFTDTDLEKYPGTGPEGEIAPLDTEAHPHQRIRVRRPHWQVARGSRVAGAG